MPTIEVTLEEPAWPDIADTAVIDMTGPEATPWKLAGLPQGMQSGAASVALRIDLPDGRIVVTETSLAALVEAVEVLHVSLHGRGVHDGP